MLMSAALATAGLFFAAAAVPPESVAAAADRTPEGTHLKHFNQVDEGVFKGSKPRSDADYLYLQSLHVKYIVDLEVLPFLHEAEKRKARKYGMQMVMVTVNASPVSPSEYHIEKALTLIHSKRCQPVYFHCALGRDRTALVAALYKMYFEGMSPEDGDRYLHASGYKNGWDRSGLTRYLAKHPTAPPALASTPAPRVCSSGN